MTTVDDILDTATKDKTRRDQWGRYLVVPPDGGKPVGYTRATTVAKALDDTSNLMAWGKRMTAIGLARRPDLLALAATCEPDDRDTLNDICDRAAETGGATARRDLGTALHAMLEHKIADPTWQVPAPYDADIDATLAALADAGYQCLPAASERMVVNDTLKIAGTADFAPIEQLSDGKLLIADFKTGASVAYGALAWAIQLGIYATADAVYIQGPAKDGSQDVREPMPAVDQTEALIIHCQPGSGVCDLHVLDIATGIEALQVAMEVRRLRTVKNILVPLAPATSPKPDMTLVQVSTSPVIFLESSILKPDATILAPLLHRIKVMAGTPAGPTLAAHWPSDVPTPKHADTWTIEQFDQILAVVVTVERDHSLPFQPEPVTPRVSHPDVVTVAVEKQPPIDEGPPEPETAEELRARIARLNPEQIAVANRWATEANRAGVAFSIRANPSHRRCEITRAVCAVVEHHPDTADPMMRAALGLISDAEPSADEPIGALLGALTLDEASRLATLATTGE